VSGEAREGEVLVRVTRIVGGERLPLDLPVVQEVPLTIRYNGREIITLLTLPEHQEELAVGFLASEGFLAGRQDLLHAGIDPRGRQADIRGRADAGLAERLMERRTVTSGCGKGTTFYHALDALTVKSPPSHLRLAGERVVGLAGEMNRATLAARGAGGVHHAALADGGGILLLREDIGRHNAVDKLHGRVFLDGRETAGLFLITTGRITSEILIKAAKLGVPLVVSFSRPSSLALELAGRLGISVMGGVRGRQGTLYHDAGHVT
jgi:FdhD protein